MSKQGVEQGMHGLSLEMGSSGQHSHDGDMPGNAHHLPASKPVDHPKETVPKKMTWASIASQPAKPQIRVTITRNTDLFYAIEYKRN